MITRQLHRVAGFSLLEMLLATALVAGTLVPTMSVMREAMQRSREAAQQTRLAMYAVELLEGAAARTMHDWTSDVSEGNFAADGFPRVRFSLSRSDAPSDGGVINRLMHIQVEVYDDRNNDSIWTLGEPQVAFRTKVAKLLSYENEAT